MAATERCETSEVQTWDDVPDFSSEEEERAFWREDSLGQGILNEMVPAGDDPRLPLPRIPGEQRLEPVGIDTDLLARFMAAAREHGVPYRKVIESLLAAWLEHGDFPTETTAAQCDDAAAYVAGLPDGIRRNLT
jgi:hypothetical protein